jgi:hypothetical protein
MAPSGLSPDWGEGTAMMGGKFIAMRQPASRVILDGQFGGVCARSPIDLAPADLAIAPPHASRRARVRVPRGVDAV